MPNANDREIDILLRLITDTRDSLSKQMGDGFTVVSGHLARLNGRAEANATAIAVLQSDMRSACTRVEDVEETVHAIQEKGCASSARVHAALLGRQEVSEEEESRPRVSRRDLVIGGGAAGAGMVIIKLLEYGSDLVHHMAGWK